MSTAPTDWGRVLDDLDHDLDRLEVALAEGDVPEQAPFVPPVLAGVLPPALRIRAKKTLARMHELEAVVARSLANARRSWSVHDQLSENADFPRFLDVEL